MAVWIDKAEQIILLWQKGKLSKMEVENTNTGVL